MDQIITIGLDLAKQVFQVHGAMGKVGRSAQAVAARPVLPISSRSWRPAGWGWRLAEAAHHWAREIAALGHEVRLMPPAYVKPYVERGKNDAADAAAICEAVQPTAMRFVPVKSMDAASSSAMTGRAGAAGPPAHPTCQYACAGIWPSSASSPPGAGQRDWPGATTTTDARADIPALARELFAELRKSMRRWTVGSRRSTGASRLARANEPARRLEQFPGIGPLIASLLAMKAPVPSASARRPPLRRLARLHAAAKIQRRQAASGIDQQARQSLFAQPADCRGRERAEAHKQASLALACRFKAAATLQGRSRGAGAQNGAHRLGADGQGWSLPRGRSGRRHKLIGGSRRRQGTRCIQTR